MTARSNFALTRPASPHQKQYARILMREIELPTDVITLLHRRFFEKAGVPCPEPGTRVEAAVDALTFAHASHLVDVLVKERNEQRGLEDDA